MSLIAKDCPDVFRKFSDFGKEVMRDGALPLKTKELIAFALSVASHCEPCLEHHLSAAVKAGATDAEIAETLAVCILLLGGPANVWTRQVIDETLTKMREEQPR
jgi:AhpD family alkylhydroperoxidase